MALDRFISFEGGFSQGRVKREIDLQTKKGKKMKIQTTLNRISSGIEGLDKILNGGFISGRAYLIKGGPGTGKTTLGLHFLTANYDRSKSLFITLEEPEIKIRDNAKSLNFDLEKIHFLDLSPTSEFFKEVKTYDIFSPAEVEREPITRKIMDTIESINPSRVFIDPMTTFRYLSTDIYQYRKQVLSFLRFLTDKGITVLFTSEGSREAPDDDLQFISDGVILLENKSEVRMISVIKFRGSNFYEGKHTLKITKNGIVVYPRLQLITKIKEFEIETIPSGVPELDELLNGGVERGTVTIITGPAGVGKTTLGLQFMKEAASRGERSVVYTFEEEVEILLNRCDSIGIPARDMIQRGTLSIVKIEPAQYTCDEFAYIVQKDVEQNNTHVVMIDSTSGYKLSLHGEDLTAHLHLLAKYLQNMGVVVFLITETPNIVGDVEVTKYDISYLADNIIFLRYLEIDGELRKAIGVLKKRMSDFEKALREIEITKSGIKVGKPLKNLRGILLGTPQWVKKEDLDGKS